MAKTLTELANQYGTDKGTKHFEAHAYTEVYERFMASRRGERLRLLEIGVADPSFPGASLKMWYDYFPNATIIGADIVPCPQFNNDRVTTVVMDQGDNKSILAMAKEHGPFDIIIDDGSHKAPHQLRCFLNLYDWLDPEDGQYWIEDCHVAPMTEMILTMCEATQSFCGGKLLLIGV